MGIYSGHFSRSIQCNEQDYNFVLSKLELCIASLELNTKHLRDLEGQEMFPTVSRKQNCMPCWLSIVQQ